MHRMECNYCNRVFPYNMLYLHLTKSIYMYVYLESLSLIKYIISDHVNIVSMHGMRIPWLVSIFDL